MNTFLTPGNIINFVLILLSLSVNAWCIYRCKRGNKRRKLYYTGITDILRQYLSSRYPIKAMEMTSKEIIGRMEKESLSDVSMKRLSDILLTADFVKFAKYIPDADQNEAAYTDAYYFVEETKVSEPVAVEPSIENPQPEEGKTPETPDEKKV